MGSCACRTLSSLPHYAGLDLDSFNGSTLAIIGVLHSESHEHALQFHSWGHLSLYCLFLPSEPNLQLSLCFPNIICLAAFLIRDFVHNSFLSLLWYTFLEFQFKLVTWGTCANFRFACIGLPKRFSAQQTCFRVPPYSHANYSNQVTLEVLSPKTVLQQTIYYYHQMYTYDFVHCSFAG